MIVATIKTGTFAYKVDDSAYVNRTQEEVENTIRVFSAFIAECLRKKNTA